MAHVFQVGAGSGGVVVLDLLSREPSVTRVTLVEPDVYQAHNVHRHIFPPAAVGCLKARLAADWVRERRADLIIDAIPADLTDPSRQPEFARLAAECDVGVCAVDNEPAKFAFDALFRAAKRPWTLGEVLSGGIGGWVHRFLPGGPCYGCVASYLKRNVKDEPPTPPPDYSNPGATLVETIVPAPKACIEVIASLHAVLTLEVLGCMGRQSQESADHVGATTSPRCLDSDFNSLLVALRKVPGVFDEAFRSYRLRIPRLAGCLMCSTTTTAGGDLDVALGEALDRLGPQ